MIIKKSRITFSRNLNEVIEKLQKYKFEKMGIKMETILLHIFEI
jgi:hypothetical protein